jgi:uncharacterized protein YggE
MNSCGWLGGIAATLLSVSAPLVAAEVANPAPGSGEIAVSGSGSVSVAPTTAAFTVTIETTGPTSAAAGEENARLSKAVRDALARSELKAGDIKGSSLNIGPRWDYEEGKRPRRSAFVATNSIRIETDNLAGVGSVIDVALSAGASEVSSVSFSSRDIEAARASALTKAVQDARRDAEIIAKANGGSLGALVLMNTPLQNRGYGGEQIILTAQRKGGGNLVPSEITPEAITVSSSVEGRWVFVPAAK